MVTWKLLSNIQSLELGRTGVVGRTQRPPYGCLASLCISQWDVCIQREAWAVGSLHSSIFFFLAPFTLILRMRLGSFISLQSGETFNEYSILEKKIMYEGGFLTLKFLMTKILVYAIQVTRKSFLRDGFVTYITRVGGWGSGSGKGESVHTLTDRVLATIPSTIPSVNGSKCLSGLLMNSGFSLQPLFPLYSYMPMFICIARSNYKDSPV